MNWVFIDLLDWDYDVGTPFVSPLGGSQSALCYLSDALAKTGETVSTITGTSNPRIVNGVRCLNHSQLKPELFAPQGTVTVVLNCPADAGLRLTQNINIPLTLILWTQHASDQPAMSALRDPLCRAAWNQIVCVSDWQRMTYHRDLAVPINQMEVRRNAISPAFENLFPSEATLASIKSNGLRMSYTSTPFRGLELLLNCFPKIRQRHPNIHLDVYSSMLVYGDTEDQDAFALLYEKCRETEGIDYRGSLAQPELAKNLLSLSVLAYPNTFAETSCIAVMEALAAGAMVVTSDLGALRETCDGWARLVPPTNAWRHQSFEDEFVEAIDAVVSEILADGGRTWNRQFQQVQAMNAACTWKLRAEEWKAAAVRWRSSSA